MGWSEQEKFDEPDCLSYPIYLDSGNGTLPVTILNPNWHPQGQDIEGLRMSVYITQLLCTVNIKSIGETYVPPIPDNSLPEETRKIFDEVAQLAQYKRLEFRVGMEGLQDYPICNIPLFNQDPYYRFSLMPFFSGTNNTTDVGCDVHGRGMELKMRMLDPLASPDYLCVIFMGLRRISRALPARSLTYQTSTKLVGLEPTIILNANNRRDNATIINASIPDPINPFGKVAYIKYGDDTGPGKPLYIGKALQINPLIFFAGDVIAYSPSGEEVNLLVEEGTRW